MKRLILIGIGFLVLAKYAGAQEQLTIKQQADKLFERYEYFESLPLYLKLANRHKTDVQVLERIADCYRNINQYDSAETFYSKATAYVKASKISHYYYAEILLRNQKFDQAKEQYRLYFIADPATLALKLATCDSAALWMGKPSGFKIKNEIALNTAYSDWGLNYDGKTGLVFNSDRVTDGQDVDKRTGNNWFKLYGASINGNEIKQLTLAADSDSFSDDYHVGPMAINKTADTAYITITTGISKKKLALDKPGKGSTQKLYTRRLLMVMAAKRNGEWVVFGSFPYNNIQKYSLGDAALSKNGRIIYFTSDMPGGEGKTDIWYCEKRADGSWGNPVNCGKTINTPEEDAFPTIGGDGALYYASKGFPGMGGYDIYKSNGEKSQWSAPQNLKYPINTTSDDFYLVTPDGLTGYLSSNREGGQGSDDIYSFTYKPLDKVPSKPKELMAKTSTPVLKPATPTYYAPGFVLTTIYYDLDKSDIRPDAVIEMDKLVTLLKQHSELKIELSSYTDSRASDDYNMALSQRRAAAATAYLVKNGIAKNRLVSKFYGEANLVNNCGDNVQCTEAEHQLNRRTEFKVTAGGD